MKKMDANPTRERSVWLRKLFKIMKLTFLLIFVSTMLVSAGVYSQNTRLSLDYKDISIGKLLQLIEEQTEYRFAYSKSRLNPNELVSIEAKNENLEQILRTILDKDQLTYRIIDRYVVISDNAGMEQNTVQQTKSVSGKISDSSGLPLPGVSVVIKGTTTGTITDANGKYSLSNISANSIIQYSFVGMKAQEISVGNKSVINVTMEDETIGLEEVVAVGYGTQKKSDITGSVASVKSDDLKKIATPSPVAALQGRAAGVVVTQESGSPDATASIKIRGVGTTNDASPLYVVDGFPMSDINYLNPNDIESLEILKDASACAIYGSRGANGVVLITTKRGKGGVMRIDFNAYFGIQSLANAPSMLNSKQYAVLSNEAYVNAGKNSIYSNTDNLPYDTNWYDEVSHLGKIQNYNVSLNGGSEKLTSMFSANYYKNQGIIKSTDYEKISVAQSNTMKVTKFFNLNTSLSATFSNYKSLDPTSIFLASLISPPDIPVINPQTNYYSGITKMRLVNPVGRIGRNNDENKRNYLVGNINAELNITKNLTFNSRFGIRYDGTYNSGFSPVYYETMDNSATINQVSRSSSKMIDWTWENILTFHKKFNEIHDLTFMGAISAREYSYDTFSATKQNVPIEDKEYWYLSSATVNPQTTGTGSSLSMVSYLGRINYNLKNRYLLTGSVRADGSSRFIGSNRWGVFPSGAFAWKLSEEDFFKGLNLTFLNSAKVRLGYGELGNENISSYYPYLTPISQQQYYTLGTSQARINGSIPSGIGNSAAKWETSTQSNAGVDLSFLSGKLGLTLDYYIRKTDDILLSQQVPVISGSSTMVRNVGGMENKGFEVTVSYKGNKGAFSYNIGANLATVNNKVTSLGTSSSLISSFAYDYVLIDFQGALGNMIRSEVGKPYGQFYGYTTDGIFQNQTQIDEYVKDGKKIQSDAKPGDFKFKDLNNNGKIDDGDMTFIGNPIPNITYGLSFDASYKKFDVSLLLQGTYGNDIYNAAKYYFMRFDGRQNVLTDYLDKYWNGENTSNDQPAVTNDLSRNSRNYRNSDFYVEDGSYLRVKTLQLGYNFSPKFNNGLKPNFRFYVSAQNLLTITKYSGFEPEVSGISVDRGQYPQPRIFMLGTVINF